ncbi:MAG: hypothetical protein ABW194_10290 [Novosphingobium sp.]
MLANAVVIEAIARQLCVTATYNRSRVVLAPHILYTRHESLFIDAVTLERDGQPPRELRLGSFKLDGLGAVALDERRFNVSELFEPATERYAGTALFAVE